VLLLVLDWCVHHAHGSKPISKSARPSITPWEERFFKKLGDTTIFEVICAADHMEISYLLIVCYRFAIANHRTPHIANRPDESFFQNLSTSAIRSILVEQKLHKARLSIESAMQSAQGRVLLDAFQHSKRHKTLSKDLAIHDRWRSKIEQSARITHRSGRPAII
jgi:hypothetical protein